MHIHMPSRERAEHRVPVILISLVNGISRLTFTLSTLAVLVAVELMINPHFGALLPGWIERLGFTSRDLTHLEWERFVTATLLVDGRSAFVDAVAMITLAVGAAEWLTGTPRALLTFWGGNLITLVAMSALLLALAHAIDPSHKEDLFIHRDVGPSAGYYGCLGLVIALLPRPWRWAAAAAILTWLAVALLTPPGPHTIADVKLQADLAHFLVFPLGYLSARLGHLRASAGGVPG
jgi:hypothetical protein